VTAPAAGAAPASEGAALSTAGAGGRALVLGGGGITGIAWEVGIVYGLRQAGIDLTGADLVVGTSAGSIVATMVTTGVDTETAFAMQREATAEPLDIDVRLLLRAYAIMRDSSLDPREARVRIGELALNAPLGDEDAQVKVFTALMPQEDWPARPLIVTGVDADTGEPVAWTRDSGVPLVRAVTASCAVPCVYPPVRINGRRYLDGGLRSGINADLAAGAADVTVIAPMAGVSPLGGPAAELEALRAQGAAVTLITPDRAARRAIGPNVLDASRRTAALDAGLAQARSVATAGPLPTVPS
jgi:NTE family protein